MKRKIPLWLWQLWQHRHRVPSPQVTVARTAQFYVAPDRLLCGLGEGEPEASRSAAREAFERLKGSRDHL